MDIQFKQNHKECHCKISIDKEKYDVCMYDKCKCGKELIDDCFKRLNDK